MSNLTLKEFISELNARLEKFSHDELKEIIRGHAMNLPPRERRGYLDRFVRPEKPKGTRKSTKPTMTDGEFLLPSGGSRLGEANPRVRPVRSP